MITFNRTSPIAVGSLDAHDYASDCVNAIRVDTAASRFFAYVTAGYEVSGSFVKGKHANQRVVELDYVAAIAALDYSDLSAVHALIEAKEAE